LVEEVIDGLTQDLEDRKITWRISALGVQECDPAMIRQVYSNLIGNAIKFTRESHPAVIEIGALDFPGRHGQKVFFVRDNGVGFDMEYKEKLFGVFQRLHRQEEFEGTGIGLANVKRIVNRHGGDAWAEGEVGKGATLYFSLPKKVEAA
jgi:light-regulated signal transduction histidine kinase (bacteriophytochrome)